MWQTVIQEKIVIDKNRFGGVYRKLIYDASIVKNKPKSKYKELLSVEEGGHSYWSHKTHRWVSGRFDRNSKKFVTPKKDL